MAEQEDVKEATLGSELVAGTNNLVALGVVYAIKSVSSGRYFDGRNPGMSELAITFFSDVYKDNTYLHWTVIKVNKGYALKSVSSSGYMDGRNPGMNEPIITYRDPQDDKHLSWTFVKTNGKYNIAIKSVSGGGYLDGRDPDMNDPALTVLDPMNNPYLQWNFVPMNYKLNAVISAFDFGDATKVEKVLEANKQVAFVSKDTIVCEAKGITQSGEYGKEVEDSFTYGFQETIGVGVESEMSCGVPLVAEAKFKVSASFEFSANQSTSTSEKRNFKKSYSFTPEATGVYECGMIVYCVKNQKMPFSAEVLVTAATTTDGDKKPYSGNQIAAMLYYGGFDCKITDVGDTFIKGAINGYMTASYAVSSQTYSKRIGDVPKND